MQPAQERQSSLIATPHQELLEARGEDDKLNRLKRANQNEMVRTDICRVEEGFEEEDDYANGGTAPANVFDCQAVVCEVEGEPEQAFAQLHPITSPKLSLDQFFHWCRIDSKKSQGDSRAGFAVDRAVVNEIPEPEFSLAPF